MKLTPVVKWAGGKKQLLNELKKYAPKEFETYYEPFIGGGALFLDLMPNKSVINDINKELIALYRSIKNPVYRTKMLKIVDSHTLNHSEKYYYEVRNLDRNKNYSHLPLYVRAARTLYLNKSCFNGLYRVNSKGYFNVPFNKEKTVNCYDIENMDLLGAFFEKTNPTITSKSFAAACSKAKKGDFVYFDPPYDKQDGKDSFTTYTKGDFGKNEQVKLAKLFKKLDKRGVKLMLSNSNTQLINELYAPYKKHVVLAKRMINSNAKGRGNVEELIITNY